MMGGCCGRAGQAGYEEKSLLQRAVTGLLWWHPGKELGKEPV